MDGAADTEEDADAPAPRRDAGAAADEDAARAERPSAGTRSRAVAGVAVGTLASAPTAPWAMAVRIALAGTAAAPPLLPLLPLLQQPWTSPLSHTKSRTGNVINFARFGTAPPSLHRAPLSFYREHTALNERGASPSLHRAPCHSIESTQR